MRTTLFQNFGAHLSKGPAALDKGVLEAMVLLSATPTASGAELPLADYARKYM